MKVKNLDGEVVDVLSSREILVDGAVMRLKKWFVEKNIHELERLRECHIEKETAKAYLLMNDKGMLWVPKSVIEEW